MTMMYKRDQDMEVKMINENVSKHASAGAGKIDIKHKRRDGSKSDPKILWRAQLTRP